MSRNLKSDCVSLRGFVCVHCGVFVPSRAYGTCHRNHCPICLWSIHVDIRPGDRACLCRGKMEPISLWIKLDREVMILHRCMNCGTIKPNRCAGDDDPGAIASLARQISSACEIRE